ncbi:thioredoxin superfamily protein, partial [Trifolium medium]|nr:thioredoxin superfamily protein [Trifolium medium]
MVMLHIVFTIKQVQSKTILTNFFTSIFRPKDNERIRDELEKAVHIIWNCRLPSPRCVALDAVVETELVAALKVSVFPEVIFTKAGKILFRDK